MSTLRCRSERIVHHLSEATWLKGSVVRGEFLIRGTCPNFKQKEIEMRGFVQKVQRFLVSEDGPTAVEYAVMLALIVIVALTAIQTVGTRTSATFNNIASKMPTS